MSDARDPRADDTDLIPPDGPAGEPIEFDAADPTVGEDEPSTASTLDLEPGLRVPVVAETLESPSPSVDGTLDMPSPGEGATLDMPVSGGSKEPHGGRRTEVGTRVMTAVADSADDATDDDPMAEVGRRPAGATIRPSRPIGVDVPGYEILAEIGRGGMGVVYKARHIRLDRLVALKMILAGAHASDDQIARFHIEARAVARIQHPGIVQIHEVGDLDGLPYFSLEFVPGGSLSQFINGRPQAPRVAATMVMALCRAMAEAHARGIIHRDLKPANVLLTPDGQPKITDFGLAKQMEGDSQQTRSGAIMGTPSYMAPEQAWGQTREIGPLSDQYALGAILYEMIVGRPPFQGATPLETLELVRNQEPVPPTRLQPRTPTDLETICLKALQKDPAKRFPDAGAMAEDLRRFLDGEPIVARPVGAPERLWRWCQRNPRVAVLAAAVVLMGIAITAGSAAFAVSLKRATSNSPSPTRRRTRRRRSPRRTSGRRSREERRDRRPERRGRRPQEGAPGAREGRGAGPGGVRPDPQRAGGATRPQRPAQSEAPLDPGDAGSPRGADQHDADRPRGHDRLPGAARHGGPRQGRIRGGHPDARRDQSARRPDRHGIWQVRRDDSLLPPDGGALRATGRGRTRRARTAEGQGQRQGDSRRLPDGPDRRRRGRPEVLRPGARPPSSVAGPGAVQ